MGLVEELSDDFGESLNLNQDPENAAPLSHSKGKRPEPSTPSQPSNETPFPIKENRSVQNASASDPMAPGLPPAMASIRSYTADELVQVMNKTPLFMSNLDDVGDEEGDNMMLDALRSLQNEGTRAEVALNFREQGNEHAKAKNWRDAKEFYTKGIAVLNAKEDKWDKPKDVEVEQKMLREAAEACYINRALCNLELKNYRSTTSDCAAVLRVNPKNIKAYYRSSMALLALDKIGEAEDASSLGLTIDKNNQSLQVVATKIEARKVTQQAIAAKNREEQDRVQKQKQLLKTALQARNISVRKTDQPPDMEDARVQLAPDPLSPESSLVFPTLLLYPMDGQSDFIKAFSEMDSISDHLNYIFPLPWDTVNDYRLSAVDCYIQTITGGLIKAGKKLPLLEILGGGSVEVIDDLITIFVIPTAKSAKWIETFKTRRGKR